MSIWNYVLVMFMIHVVGFDDVCASNPCQNGGSCYSNFGIVTCFCDQRHTGTRCEGVYITKCMCHTHTNTLSYLWYYKYIRSLKIYG